MIISPDFTKAFINTIASMFLLLLIGGFLYSAIKDSTSGEDLPCILKMLTAFALLMWIGVTLVNERIVKNPVDTTEKILIVKASNMNEISGAGTGNFLRYQMEVHEDNIFVYYYYLPNGDIRRSTLPFNFPIREVEGGNEAYLEKHTSGKDADHITVDYILFVPKGTLTDALEINLQ